MPFFQMDDGFDSELRVMRAGTAAFGLYARCGIWVSRNLQDGFVPAEIAAQYGTREWIERLVDAGLWSPASGGFVMPDYLEPHGNWSAEKVLAYRAAAAERQARARARRTEGPDEGTSRSESRVTNGVSHNDSHAVSHTTPHPPHPTPQEPPTDSLRSSVPPEGPDDDPMPPKPKPKRGTRIPDGFELTDEMRTWGKTNFPQVNGEAETEAFVDYWRALPGARGVKLDWTATWRNWIRKAADGPPGRPPRPAERPTPIPPRGPGPDPNRRIVYADDPADPQLLALLPSMGLIPDD